MKFPTTLLIAGAAGLVSGAVAQDAGRGARLYADTARVTGRPVAACVSCHSDMSVLRELIVNRRGKPDDPAAVARRLDSVIAGAQPGVANAKAQYRGVLTPTDLRDLAAYIARAKQVRAAGEYLADAKSR
jgi:cytochrome c553